MIDSVTNTLNASCMLFDFEFNFGNVSELMSLFFYLNSCK